MNVFGTDPAPREKQGERTKKKESMPSHVFADWYHIMITVLKIVPTRQTFHHERLRNRKWVIVERHGFEDAPKKQGDGTTKTAWYTKSRAFACLRTRGLRKARACRKVFDLGGKWPPLRRTGLHKFQLLVHVLGWVGPITDHNHEGFLG